MLVTDKKTRETFEYYQDNGSGYPMCAKVGHIDCNGAFTREWNAKGELIRITPNNLIEVNNV